MSSEAIRCVLICISIQCALKQARWQALVFHSALIPLSKHETEATRLERQDISLKGIAHELKGQCTIFMVGNYLAGSSTAFFQFYDATVSAGILIGATLLLALFSIGQQVCSDCNTTHGPSTLHLAPCTLQVHNTVPVHTIHTPNAPCSCPHDPAHHTLHTAYS